MAAGGSPAAAAAGGVRFVPLLGVHSQQPLSYLLELDGFTFLLDCGWNDAYDPRLLQPVVEVLPHIDAVLLSHSDPAHLGALPYLVGHCGLRAPVYATSPVHKMGQMFMYDQYLSRQAVSDFDVFNLDDVDTAFALVQSLRYQQNLSLSGKGAGIVITPFAAGHMLGGAVWRISKGGEDYVYAVDYNHRKERHLSGTSLESAFRRPALLITDAFNALQLAPERPGREQQLLNAVMATLRGDGSVLMPIDTAGRLLELVLLLERHWAEHRLTYPLVLLSAMAYSTLEFAKSQLEWMNEALVRSLGHSRDNPFSTRFLKLCSSREELAHLPRGPKLVLATLPSLEAGFSRQLFLEWAAEPRNAVAFVTPGEPGTLAERVLRLGAERDAAGPAAPLPTLRLVRSRRVPLEGRELEEHLAQQARRAEEEAAAAVAAAAAAEAVAAEAAEAALRDGATAAELLGPRTSVQRVSSLAIGHLRSQRGGTGTAVLGEVVAPDGRPVAEVQAPAAVAAAACLVEGFEAPRGAAAPMFPFEDEWEGMAYDEYGAALDETEFEAAQAPAFKAMEAEMEAEAEAEDAAAPPNLPTKIESEEVDVTLRCAVLRFDFDGRSDGRSVRTMLAHVAPRQLILVHGTAESSAALAEHLRGELASLLTRVHTPAAGQAVELAAEPSYRLALSDELMAGLRQHRIGDYHLAWVEGVVGPPADGSESQLPQLLPAAGAGAEGGYGGVFIGDARLSELKQALAAAGIASEFHAGALYCSGHVVVRRCQAGGGADGGGLELEGALSEEYYRIREVVYGQYHIC